MSNTFEQIHDAQVKALVKKLGSKALSDTDIRKEATVLKLPTFKGVHMQNSVLPDGNCTYIVNQDVIGGGGIHWVAVVQQNKICYVYDSFGRSANKLISKFHHDRIAKGYKVKNTDLRDQDQYGTKSLDCGHRCLSALMIYKKHGIDAYMAL